MSFCRGAGVERWRLGGVTKKKKTPFSVCVCVLNFKDGLISHCDPDSKCPPAIGGGREAGRYRGRIGDGETKKRERGGGEGAGREEMSRRTGRELFPLGLRQREESKVRPVARSAD